MAYLSEGSKVGGKQIETVDGAQAKVNALKNNEIEPLKTRVSNAEKSINQLSNEVSSKVSRTEFESLQIGGRNLLINSDFSKTYKGNPFTVDGKTYDTYPSQWNGYDYDIGNSTTSYHAHIDDDTFGFNVVEFNESNGQRHRKRIYLSGLEERLSPTQIGTFTFSVDVYATGTGTRLWGGFYYYRKSDGQRGLHSGHFNIQPTEVNKWVRMSAQCRLNDDVDFSRTIQFYIYGFNFTTNSILYIKNVKLEYGNKPTDWTPAIEDVEAYAEQKAQEAFDAVEVGGRNLLRNSGKERISDNRNFQSIDYEFTIEPNELLGKTVTFSIEAKTDNGTDRFQFYPRSEDGDWSAVEEFVPTTEYRRYTRTFIFNVEDAKVLRIRHFHGENTGTLYVRNAKLEIGNKATDWTPAPEDMFQEITNVKNSSAPISHVGSGGNAHALATPSAHGFMSSSDKAKLDGIQAGAEVNQNAFTHIKVGSTTVSADSKTDTLELVAGTNVVLTPDATNDKITIGLSSNVETTSGAQAKVDAHANRKDNPHSVTKAQVGLGNVENYSIATQAEAEAGTANNKYMTPLRTMQLLNKKIHVGSSAPSNPRQGDLWIW